MICFWCNKIAYQITYRTIDGITGKSIECENCHKLSTKFLLERRYS